MDGWKIDNALHVEANDGFPGRKIGLGQQFGQRFRSRPVAQADRNLCDQDLRVLMQCELNRLFQRYRNARDRRVSVPIRSEDFICQRWRTSGMRDRGMTGLLSLSSFEEWEKHQAGQPQKSGAIGRRPYLWSEHLQIHLKALIENMNCHVGDQWLRSNAQHWKWRVPHYQVLHAQCNALQIAIGTPRYSRRLIEKNPPF